VIASGSSVLIDSEVRRSLLAGAHKFDPRRQRVLPPDMLKHFKANLNVASELLVIGYSFGDTHINEVLRDWLEFSDERALHIVDVIERASAKEFLDRRAGIVRARPWRGGLRR
jgi:hypothetical protein